jgi:hypothetical protein
MHFLHIIVVLTLFLCFLLVWNHSKSKQQEEKFTFFGAAEKVCGSNITPACVDAAEDDILYECQAELAISNGSCPPQCYGSFDPMCLLCMQRPCDQYCLTDGPESFACQECMSFCERPF